MKKLFLLGLAAMITVLAACSAPAVSGQELVSDKPRETAPAIDQSDMAKLVSGNSEFAFNLYRVLSRQEGNLFYSPYSISLALAMTYSGANGLTEKQMAEALRFGLPQNRLHPAFNSLDLALASRGEGAKGKDGEGFRLNIANAIWGQKDYRFLPAFLDLLAENYGAGLRVLDFMKSPEPSRLTINEWVSDRTEGKIKDLLPPGTIDQYTRLVLTNAIYFNAAWLFPFQKTATADAQFNLINGDKVTVPFMKQTESFGYAAGNGYRAVELPYDGRQLSMVVIVPDKGKLGEFEKSLTSAQVNDILVKLADRQVALSFPKFKFEAEFKLKDTLSEMGMPVAFTDGADFSGMTGKRDLLISEVVHKAFVAVDEEGTEAAAATGVIMKLATVPAAPVELTVDSPFIFLIRDIETGSVLFIGRVLNPAS